MAKASKQSPKSGVKSIEYWTECHIPRPIAQFLVDREQATVRKPDHVIARAQRFHSFWETAADDAQLKRSWKALADAAISDEKLTNLFLVMPDKAQRDSFLATHGIRNNGQRQISIKEERERYAQMAQHVQAIRTFLFANGCRDFRNLLSDAQATGGDAAIAAREFRERSMDLRATLQYFEQLLKNVDPTAKFPYGQPDASDAAQQSFIALVADLNRHLTKPKFAALAYLAHVNVPEQSPSKEAIRKAWNRRETGDVENNADKDHAE